MKKLFSFIVLALFTASSYAQSPLISVKFNVEDEMYHGDTCHSVRLTKVFFYEPKRERKVGLSVQDTSKYDWSGFPSKKETDFDVQELVTPPDSDYATKVALSNHSYAFEYAIKIMVTRFKCGKTEEMSVFFPVIISSLETFIDLGTIYFRPGDFDISKVTIYSRGEYSRLDLTMPADFWFK